ncbi:MAG: xylulokinase [Anaerolineales bacterium]|nr:xylulokinase [Anaerolineales bacterium]
MNKFLGIDLGTTGLKATILTEEGKIIASAYVEYPILSPEPGYAEQDPLEWWNGLISNCRELKQKYPADFKEIAGIGICGQMHTQVYLDKNNNILRPAITWMDLRSKEIADRINSDEKAKALVFAETQNFTSTTYTAPQIRWVIENQPDVWAKVSKILIAKDYVKFRLTGEMVTDTSDASGTLFFNVKERMWSREMFDFFGVPRAAFPEARPSDVIMGCVSQEASALTGLKEGIPVANGSSDNSASALGAGMTNPGQVTLIIGTAGVVSVCSDRPLVDPEFRTLCWNYSLRDRWATVGITQTAGESLNWFKNAFDRNKDNLSSGDIFEQYNQDIAEVPDGSGGVIFLPYLNGERTPYWDPAARGVFYGLNLTTEKTHFIKAIMEGVSFALRNNIEAVESLGIKINQVRAVGGGLKSKVWLETLGKILRIPIATVSVPDTGNLGNMLLCGKALGVFSSYEEAVKDLVSTDQEIFFDNDTPVYEKQYQIFLQLYRQLQQTFRLSLSN